MQATPPLYRKILEQIRTDIRSGALPVGAALPSEKQIGERFAVSRITVRRALAELAQEGLVDRSGGRVARVAAPRFVQALAGFEDPFGILRLVHGTSVQLLSFEWQVAHGAVARALRLDDGDQVLHFQRLRKQAGLPVYHTQAYLPAAIGALINRKALDQTSMHEVLAAAGVLPEAVERRMGAAPCPKNLAKLLDLKSGAPTFRMERTSRDEQGEPLHLLIGHWRWDRFSMRLNSTSSAEGGLLTIDPPDQEAGSPSNASSELDD